jgi:hypothetical protein
MLSYCTCPRPIEDDTEIFDTIYKWDVPSIQLKVVPRHSTSFREVDRLSLPFIDLYVPALTPWLHSSEATLEFIQHATLMFLCCVYTGIVFEQSKVYFRCRGASFLYKLYITGASTQPCGTPAATFLGEESSPSTETLNFLSVKKEAISLWDLSEIVTLIAYIVGQGAMLCQRPFRYPRIQQLSTYCYWNSDRRDPLASYIGMSCCDAHGSQTDLLLASFFPKCVYELFLELISRKVCP